MADTHINAFFADVEAAKVAVRVAQGELEGAEARLEAKKLEVGYEEPADVQAEATVEVAVEVEEDLTDEKSMDEEETDAEKAEAKKEETKVIESEKPKTKA